VPDLDFGALVAAVPHDDDCPYNPAVRTPACMCRTRDARIGRGIKAVRESDEIQWTGSDWIERKDDAAARAFEEASR
jgi:hypothetical protein